LRGCNVVPPFFLLGMEVLAFVLLADMAEVEGKEECVEGLEALCDTHLTKASRLCDTPSYDTYERC
jgi:hypothetical protein